MAASIAMTQSTILMVNMEVHTVMTALIIRMPPVPRYTMNTQTNEFAKAHLVS